MKKSFKFNTEYLAIETKKENLGYLFSIKNAEHDGIKIIQHCSEKEGYGREQAREQARKNIHIKIILFNFKFTLKEN